MDVLGNIVSRVQEILNTKATFSPAVWITRPFFTGPDGQSFQYGWTNSRIVVAIEMQVRDGGQVAHLVLHPKFAPSAQQSSFEVPLDDEHAIAETVFLVLQGPNGGAGSHKIWMNKGKCQGSLGRGYGEDGPFVILCDDGQFVARNRWKTLDIDQVQTYETWESAVAWKAPSEVVITLDEARVLAVLQS